MSWCTYPMKPWYTNNSPFTNYTTVTPHSDSRSDFSAYVTSHVNTTHKIIVCIDSATVLRANIMRIAREYKAGEGMLSYSWLTNWCLAPPLRVLQFSWTLYYVQFAYMVNRSYEPWWSKAYNPDLRRRMIYQRKVLNYSPRLVSTNLGVSVSTVRRIERRFDTEGNVEKRCYPEH